MARQLRYYAAINEAIRLAMAADPTVYMMGLGVPDPKGIFGSTLGLREAFGDARVMDMPTAENGMTGVAIGSALAGCRPIMTHQRVEFALMATDQIVNQAANWHYMFGGQMSVPLVIRMIIGRGWGPGPQHSQSLQAFFSHIPGLKVVMPATSHDAKGLLISSIEDNNPVVFLEHRWLYNTFGDVPEGIYRVPLGKARVARSGQHLTVAATSHMVVEAMRAADLLSRVGVEVEVIDIRSLRPFDGDTIVESVRRTGHLIVADTAWKFAGFGAEVIASVTEQAMEALKSRPRRIALAPSPVPTTPALAALSYPRARDFISTIGEMLGCETAGLLAECDQVSVPPDVPDSSFTGPF